MGISKITCVDLSSVYWTSTKKQMPSFLWSHSVWSSKHQPTLLWTESCAPQIHYWSANH